MEYVAVTCQKCGRKMYVLRKCARDRMYCTIHCLESGNSSNVWVLVLSPQITSFWQHIFSLTDLC